MFNWLRAVALAAALSPAAWSQWTPFAPEQLSRIQRGIRDIYNMEYARATGDFQAMIKQSPDDPAGYTYLAFTYWIQELSGKQELSIDRFAASDFFSEMPKYSLSVEPAIEARFREASELAIQKAYARLEKNPRDPAARYLLGLANENLCSFEASLKRSWWAAFRYGTKTYKYHSQLLQEHPEFYDARLATGVYNYVTGSLGWSVKWLAYLTGHHGSKTQGMRDLKTAMEKGVLASDDARLMLILIYTREKNYAAALEHMGALRKKYPQNYLIPLDMGGMALLMGQPARAVGIYQDILRRRELGERKYTELERASLYNRLAVAFRESGDFEASASWSREALADKRASPRTRTLASLEFGKTLDRMGRREDARKLYQGVVAAEDVAGSRSEAQGWLIRAFR